MNFHARSIDEIRAELGTDARGLDDQEVVLRRQRFGPNRLPAPARASALQRLLLQFHSVLIYVLLGAAGVTLALQHVVDGLVILAVVVVNAILGFVQEGKAERALDAVRSMLAPTATVLRGGVRRAVAAHELVPGDVVWIEAGDRVPADLRLQSARGLAIQEALLTGESVPSQKSSQAVAVDAPVGDRVGMAFSGTLVASGQGSGIVVATGAATELGRIGKLLTEVTTLTTPLVRQMDVFARWLTLLILVLAAVLLVFGYVVEHHEFRFVFLAVVGLSVAAIPEGLPAVLTITLAVGVRQMARRHAIVRRLPAIETLGAVSVICTDKTGTLTRNEMVVRSVATATGSFTVAGSGYEPVGAVVADSGGPVPRELLRDLAVAAALCNDATLRHDADGWTVVGDPMEGALLALAGKLEVRGELLAEWPRRDGLPFDSRHRFMATLHHGPAGRVRAFVKGAPEQLLGMSRSQRGSDGDLALEAEVWQQRAERLAAEGQRVLAIAVVDLPAGTHELHVEHLQVGLTLLGLVGLIDPPRPEAIAAVADCHAAGIVVKMITGDHAGTAAAIGRQVGLQRTERVLTGAEIEGLDDQALAAAVRNTDVFARTSPEHKLRLVTALQAHGMTVAMTGDGVNDAPALKRADVGIAMGKHGSEAAKEAAEFVLTDDNFASIAAAVREGRTVHDNILKVISWTLPTSAGEAATILAALLAGTSLPITAVQVLWVNLITAVTLGMALAFEPSEAGTMRRPPRRRDQALLTGGLAWHIVFVSLLILAGVYGMHAYATDRGYPVPQSQTIAMNTLVVMEIFHLFFIRNLRGVGPWWRLVRGTKVVWATVLAVTVAQFAVTYLPWLQPILGTQAVAFGDGLVVVGVGVVFFAVLEIEKQLRFWIGAPRFDGANGSPTAE